MDSLGRLSRLHADGIDVVERINQSIVAEQAEVGDQLRSGEMFILSRPQTGPAVVHLPECSAVTSQVDRKRAWELRAEAAIRLVLRKPRSGLDSLLEEVLEGKVGLMPRLVSMADLNEITSPYRPCRTCEPDVDTHTIPPPPIHFGIRLARSAKKPLTIEREFHGQIDKRSSFAGRGFILEGRDPERVKLIYLDPPMCRTYTPEWCQAHQQKVLTNFDLNMASFERLDPSEFDREIDGILAVFPDFVEVQNLAEFAGIQGIYVMILGKYKQAYVGISSDIARRIRQHWSRRKPFDRMIFGSVNDSVLSVDCFGPLDTTRILALQSKKPHTFEEVLVAQIDPRFLLNRVQGGGSMLRLPRDPELTGQRDLTQPEQVD